MNTNNNSAVNNFIDEDTRSLLDRDCATFFLDQAEKRLVDTIQTSMRITERAYVFAGMMLTIFVALFSGLVNTPPLELNSWWSVVFCIEGCCFSLLALIILLTKVMTPYQYRSVGKIPTQSAICGFVKHYNQEGKPIFINLIANELCVLALRITSNRDSNELRSRYVKAAIHIVLYGTCASFLTLITNVIFILF